MAAFYKAFYNVIKSIINAQILSKEGIELLGICHKQITRNVIKHIHMRMLATVKMTSKN